MANSRKFFMRKASDLCLVDTRPRPPFFTSRNKTVSSGLKMRSAYSHFLIEELTEAKSLSLKLMQLDLNQTKLRAYVLAEKGRCSSGRNFPDRHPPTNF